MSDPNRLSSGTRLPPCPGPDCLDRWHARSYGSHTSGTNTLTNALTVQTIENEARVLDTDLALSLGMSTPTHIRQNIIVPNREELEGFGGLAAAKRNPGRLGGRPTTAYYVNEEQALLVCMLARTLKAKAVRAEVIRVFTAWRRGQLAPVAPASTSMKEALLLALAQCERIEQLTVEKQVLEIKQREMEPAAAVGLRGHSSRHGR